MTLDIKFRCDSGLIMCVSKLNPGVPDSKHMHDGKCRSHCKAVEDDGKPSPWPAEFCADMTVTN